MGIFHENTRDGSMVEFVPPLFSGSHIAQAAKDFEMIKPRRLSKKKFKRAFIL